MKQPFNVLRTPQPVYDPITGAIATAVGAGATGTAVIGFAVNIAVSAVASYALNALSPKPKIPGSGGFLVNEVNPTAPAEYVYGEVRKGGVVTYDEATDGNAILHRIIVLAAGEHEVGDIYLNDEVVSLSDDSYDVTDPSDPSDVYTGAGWIITEKWMEDNRIREPRIRIFVHDGSQTATTDTFANSSTRTLANELLAKTANGLDANFVGKGLTYLYVQMNIDNEVFAGGIPRITANIKRKGVYDPRDNTSKITSNWALCLADYLQADYGLGDTGSVDNTALQAEANICDEAVTLDAGGTQPRYEMNGVFRSDEQPGQILSRMMPSGAGSIFWGQGKWVIRAGEYAGSIASFGLSDLRSGIQVETRTPRAQNYNAVRGVFNDKSQRYIEGEYPRISSATFLSVDGGFENVLDYDLPFETDGIRAQRLAKQALFRQREQIRVEADFNMRAASVQPGDVIDLTIDRYGWDAKEFEVVGWTLKISETGTLCVRLSLKETSEASFDWTAEETIFDGNNTNLPDNLTVPTVVIGTPIVNYIQNPGGTEQPRVTIPWSVTSPGLVADYVFEWRENGIDYAANGGFVELGATPTAREQEVYAAYLKGLGRVPDQNGFDFYVSGGGSGLSAEAVLIQITDSAEGQAAQNFESMVLRTTRAELRSLSFGRRYDFRVYARNARGARSAYDATTYLVTPDTEAPGTPTGLHADGDFGTILLSWVNPTDLDLMHIEIWEGSTSVLGSASLLAVTQSSTYVRANLAPQTQRYYWIRASDYTGNLSGFAGPVNATTRRIETLDIGPAVIDYENLTPTAQGIIEAIEGDLADFLDGYTGSLQQLTLADLTAVSGDISGTYVSTSTLTSNYYTAANTDGAISAAITSFESTFIGDNNLLTTAAANAAYYTKATTDSLISAAVTTLEGDIGDTYATLSQTAIIQGDLDDIEASWGVDVDINGIASGFQLLSGSSTSAFNIRADQFNIFPPSGGSGGSGVFSVFSTSRTIGGVFYPAGTYIDQAYIDAASIVGLTADNLTVTNLADITSNFNNDSTVFGLTVGTLISAANDGMRTYRYSSSGHAFAARNYNGPAGQFLANINNSTGSGDAIVADNGGGAGSTAIDARSTRSGGGHAQIALSVNDGGYGMFIPATSGDGGLDASGGGWAPFTGVHMGMLAKSATCVPGDILVDKNMIIATLSDGFSEVEVSSFANQAGAIGVLQKVKPSWILPPAFVDRESTRAAQALAETDNDIEPVLILDPANYHDDYDLVDINAVGEGSVSVIGETGDIAKGDLIVTSSTPGKGMKQADDVVRSYTVAKARESVTFDTPDQVKMIACIYLCG